MVHHHTITKVKKVTKEKIKCKRISDSDSPPMTSHKKRKKKSHKKEHKKKQGKESSSSESESSSSGHRLVRDKRRKKHKYDSATADLLKVYERDAEIFQPLANFVDDRMKLAGEVISSVKMEYVCALFPKLKNSTINEVVKFLSEMLKYMSRERILALLNGTEISSSSATSVDGYEDDDDDLATSSQNPSPNHTTNKNFNRRQLLSGSEQSDTEQNCLYVTHSEAVQCEITTYGIVDINGDVIPTKKRRSQEPKPKVELEEGEVNSGDDSCKNDHGEYDAFGESVAYVNFAAGEERTVTIQGSAEVYSVSDDNEESENTSAHSNNNCEPIDSSIPKHSLNCVENSDKMVEPYTSSESEEEGVIESSSEADEAGVLNVQSNEIKNSPPAVVNISDDEITSRPYQVHAVSSTSNCKATADLDEGEIEEDDNEDLPNNSPQSARNVDESAQNVEAEEEVDEYFEFELVE